jgi:hypothetical protein
MTIVQPKPHPFLTLRLDHTDADLLRIILQDWLDWDPECVGGPVEEQSRHERIARRMLHQIQRRLAYTTWLQGEPQPEDRRPA